MTKEQIARINQQIVKSFQTSKKKPKQHFVLSVRLESHYQEIIKDIMDVTGKTQVDVIRSALNAVHSVLPELKKL